MLRSTRWREKERQGEKGGGDGRKKQRVETERERYGEQGRLIEQLRNEKRAEGIYGFANKRRARCCCKLFAL